jgi:glycosyltransferase involved in cell wall biosynthesis
MATSPQTLRILAVSALWQGANDYAFVRAFRRLGHSVSVVSSDRYVPDWRSVGLRILRRALMASIVSEYNSALLQQATAIKPDLLFVFKGAYVKPETIAAIKANGTVAINFYPDVSFRTHGPYLPSALPLYDWVFTTKSFGLADMAEQLAVENASFLPHAYDPETHRPVELDDTDRENYLCDVSFIGNWSPKKQKLLEHVRRELPDIDLRIWGPDAWRAVSQLTGAFQSAPVLGTEYAKAINGSAVNLAILSEQRTGARSGDQITSRTFHIPAAGGFMLHERTDEAVEYFVDGKECAFFSGPDDLVAKLRHFVAHPEERRQIAAAGRERSLASGYSVDARVQTVLERYAQLRQRKSLGR